MGPQWDCGMEAQCCWFNISTDCKQGQVPTLVVNATTPEQIQKAVRFAEDRNLGITVKSTGHDF